jgi:hypothetical protein
VTDPYVQDAIEAIAKRAEAVGDGKAVGDLVRAELSSKVDFWRDQAQNRTGGRTLTYEQPRGTGAAPRGTTVSLLSRPGQERWEEFTCLNSLREVEPVVKLILDDGGLDESTSPEVVPADAPTTTPVTGEDAE